MKGTPWSRIRGQNSVDKEFLETVGNVNPTDSAPKETIAVSDTIWISVQNRHSRILLRVLLRSRMRKVHREPRVLEAEAQVGKWLHCRSRTTSKELAQLHCVECGILQNACSTSHKMDADLGQSALVRIARLMNSIAKGLNRMVTKVQWLCWRRITNTIERRDPLYTTHQIHDNWFAYLRIWSRRSLHRFYGRAQTYGNQSNVFNSEKPSYVMLTFETKILRSDGFAQVILNSVAPTLQNLRIGLRKRRNGKSDVPVKKRGKWQDLSWN